MDAFVQATFEELPQLVDDRRGDRILLKRGIVLRIAPLDGTIHWGDDDIVSAWETLFLPTPEKMVVLGAIDHIDGEWICQVIVLVGEGGCVYFVDADELHYMAPSIAELDTNVSPTTPPIASYTYGQFCEASAEERDQHVLIPQATGDFVESHTEGMLADLERLNSV
ncbi:protein ORF56 [Anguillid herpesvirus 1]|uniref:Protein ORF56 n=1 Tax=Anguillid herpesvirus 1 TaxID=150286 RepID=A0A1J0REC5_9VIRU|nr:protein ORF56 [Anguillid herpesvirus 1]ADA57819.1 protein ORF56 [Anguillid herpesvirus 1]APD76219.1 ORF56 [Anguillid herpesvirus 1]QRM16349.1 protein ORF56 [Anguillid herpesvirus 1]QRM16478.1 protein ORF56 [Anguillid herpesvirus 1]QRM16608.1 protein ORF56 [Anguillid herpesvirus 1]